MEGRLRVLGRDLHRRVLLGRRGAADQERQLEPAPLHLFRDGHHLVEGRRDQPGEPDYVAALLERRVEDPVTWDHHAEVDHLVVVAAQNDADDVLADVVHVALDGCEHDLPLGRADTIAAGRLLRLHVRLQIGDRALHRAGALHDLWEEHLPRAEEIADDRHPVHQRPFDHVERARKLLPRLLGVLFDEVDDAVDERVGKAFLDGCLSPGEVPLPLGRTALHGRGVLDEAFGGVVATVEDDVLDALEQCRLDVLVDGELARR